MLPSNGTLKLVVGSAAVASVAFIFYGPATRRRKRNKGKCVGLMNLGNTCFMNAILQALAPCHSVHDWLHNLLLKTGETSNPWLVYALHNVWKVLNNLSKEANDSEDYSPGEVLDALRLHNWRISSDEQDAHELFHVFTETLDEESAKYPALLSLFDIKALQAGEVKYQNDKTAQNRIGTRLPVLPKRLQHPFRGLLASQLQCTMCGHKNAVRYDTFDSLSLMIPNRHSTLMNVDNLLQNYVTPERVQDVECDGCEKRRRSASSNTASSAKPKTTFVKTLTIGKLPQCLCIHIQRTIWLNNGMPMKTQAPVHYPQLLSMSPYVYTNRMSRQNRLNCALAGLIGGNIKQNTESSHSIRSTKLRQPYPKNVIELKALNYTCKYDSPGIDVKPNTDLKSAQNELKTNNQSNKRTNSLFNLVQFFGVQKNSNASIDAYKLMSVVEHYGDVFSGHFVTYRRGPSQNDRSPEHWLLTSDTRVDKVSREQALNAEAYMLFYERVAKTD